ncbi:unnamed protein product [Paramecium octaurelia]|uniref:Tubulin-tyrosine ligase n=1 Tax=Paramecium octaurelia TaxID=43137 RepID=A0A8S1TBF9_PAROT|nr:unnamed protein product [Paramecium octaurelia]
MKSQQQFSSTQDLRSTFTTLKRQTFFYVGEGNNGELVRQILSKRPNFQEQRTPFNAHLIWKQSNKYFNYFQLGQLKSKKVTINHLEHHYVITNKNNLFHSLENYCNKTKMNMDDLVPKTFIINLDSAHVQTDLMKFLEYFTQCSKQSLNIWLMKPPDLNRGNGIKLFNDLDQFVELMENLNKKAQTSVKQQKSITLTMDNKRKIKLSIDDQDKQIVLQKYLETPLLYNQRKFDIRVWVLIDHKLNYYFFREGYFRLATERFDINNIRNLYIHLTNNAIQKHHPYYGKFEIGNQISFGDMQRYLKFQKPQLNSIIQEMKRIVKLTIDSGYHRLNECRKNFQFEILGYDFMIDKNGHVWLIEVNTNPCIEESSPLLKQLIPRMLNDAFKLTIDQIYETEQQTQTYPVNGYKCDENLWDKLGIIQ